MGPIKEGTKEWWEAKYAPTHQFLYGKAPSSFLAENHSLLKKGETVDIAMGEGRNAVYLASKGFQVIGIDFVPIAIERAKALSKEMSAPIEAKEQDLDFFLVPLMKYDSILVTDFHPPITLMKGLARGLKPGGTLLVDSYTVEQLRLERGYRPDPIECFRPNEALEHIRELHLVLYREMQVSDTEARVQLIARRPLK